MLFYIIVLRSHIGRFLIILLRNFFKWDAAEFELGSEKSVGIILMDGLRLSPAELLNFIVLPYLLVILIIKLHLYLLSKLFLGASLRRSSFVVDTPLITVIMYIVKVCNNGKPIIVVLSEWRAQLALHLELISFRLLSHEFYSWLDVLYNLVIFRVI